MKTDKVSFTIGITEGYNHSNEDSNMNFYSLLDDVLNEVEELGKEYVSFVVTKSKVVYKKEWGCPEGGEDIYILESTRNPNYCDNSIMWKDSVETIVRILKMRLKQSTVTLDYSEVDVHYFN